MIRRTDFFIALVIALIPAGARSAPARAVTLATPFQEQVDLVRDAQGNPHIFATTSNGAFYGLGFASAEDRLFQMYLIRWSMRGQLAKNLDPAVFDRVIDSDKAARRFGWGAHADALVAAMPNSELVAVATAFAQGVNYYKNRFFNIYGQYPYTFAQLGITQLDPWTPGDCLLSWMYIQSLFEGGYGGELKADGTPATCGIPSNTVIDPTGAVVQQAWTPPLCLDDLKKNRPRAPLGREDFMKASHNLVLAGSKSTSNSSVMLGKPQLLVTNPGILYEWSIKGGSYDTRGAGVPGCPGLLVGWNRNVCWSVTAMGGDTSDLYRLSMPAANPPDTYVLDGVITPMTNVHVETIDLYGGGTTNITYQETVWGPVITEYLPQTNPPTPDQGYALCHQVLRDKSKHTIEAMLGLMTATDWCTSRAAMAKWRGPGVHFLWGDRLGNIGYTSLVSIPTRPANDPCPVSPGTQPQDGSLSASVWTGEIPFSDHPWSLNPSEGFLSTGNNLAADPATIPGNVWYGAPGDSNRSWRLRERLTELLNDTTNPSYPNIKLTPSQILAIDKDAVSPMMRVTAKLADLMLQANVLTGDAITAAQLLATWNNGLPPDQYWQFLPSITIYPYLETLAGKVGFFRAQPGQTWNALVTTYGAGASGLCNFLKHAEANLAGFAAQTDVIAWVQDRLASSYSIYINNPPTGLDQFTVYHQANAWFKAIKTPWPASILPSLEYTVTLLCPSTATIWSQPGECYKFLATMRNIDNSKAMCPPGVSENPGTATYRNHETDWLAGNMYAAPITEATVRATAISTITLFY